MGLKTIGARALVVDNNKVLFIKHTYQKGWFTIGGAVEKNETPLQAIQRELLEEVGVISLTPPELFGLYYNDFEKRDDYVAFYIVKSFKMEESNSPEIADMQWFPFDSLPEDITPATKRRLQEFLGQREKSDKW